MKKPTFDITLYLSALILLILGLLYLYTDLSNHNTVAYSKLVILGILVVIVFLMACYFYIKRRHDTLLLDLQKLRYVAEEIHTYRQYRHDHKNHMIVINDLAEHAQDMSEAERLEAIRAYSAGLLDQDNSTYFDFRTGVIALDLLLFSKLQFARENQVEMTIDIKAPMKAKSKHIITLVSILSNLLDNAYEATAQVEVASDRLIQVTFSQTPIDAIITVTNTFSDKQPLAIQRVFDTGYSTKKDQGNQGLGLTIVRKLVKRLEGNLQLNVFNERFFQLKVELPKHHLN